MFKFALDGPDSCADPLAFIYLRAQQLRARWGSAFLGLNHYLLDPSPDTAVWRGLFDFAVADYTDSSRFHPDKGFVESMTIRRLEMLV
jgi:hypothetical protein